MLLHCATASLTAAPRFEDLPELPLQFVRSDVGLQNGSLVTLGMTVVSDRVVMHRIRSP